MPSDDISLVPTIGELITRRPGSPGPNYSSLKYIYVWLPSLIFVVHGIAAPLLQLTENLAVWMS